MKLKDIINASENPSSLQLVVYNKNKIPVYVGSAERISEEEESIEIYSVVNRGNQFYKEVYLK